MQKIYAQYPQHETLEPRAVLPQMIAAEYRDRVPNRDWFSSGPSLNSFKANPEQVSVVQLANTAGDFKISVLTVLTAEGFSLQENNGCLACHPN